MSSNKIRPLNQVTVSMRNSLFIRLLMIFFLLFAQLGGLAHGIAHALTEQPQSDCQLPADDESCDLCDTYAQITSALGSSTSFMPCQNLSHVEQSTTCFSFSIAPVSFSARAPPYSA